MSTNQPPPLPRKLKFESGYKMQLQSGEKLPAIHLPGGAQILLSGYRPGKPGHSPTLDYINFFAAELVRVYNEHRQEIEDYRSSSPFKRKS